MFDESRRGSAEWARGGNKKEQTGLGVPGARLFEHGGLLSSTHTHTRMHAHDGNGDLVVLSQ